MLIQFYFFLLLSVQIFLVACTFPSPSIDNSLPIHFEYYGGKSDGDSKDQLHAKLSEAMKSEYTKTGTTIVGMCCRDGIVLGADTRSTGGPLVMDKNKLKIHQVSKYIRCCAAGTSADCTQITRRASHHLGMLRIEHELSGESSEQYPYMDPLAAAVTSISNRIRSSRSDPKQQRKVESVLILGGVDHAGPALYQIDIEGVPQRVSFSALGSGATDALAVLESERRLYRIKNNRNKVSKDDIGNSQASSDANKEICGESSCDFDVEQAVQEGHCEDITVEEAVNIVRKAVRSGILNDLGSGSHVDLCVISFDGGVVTGSNMGSLGNCNVRQWREEAVSNWDADRISRSFTSDPTTSSSSSANIAEPTCGAADSNSCAGNFASADAKAAAVVHVEDNISKENLPEAFQGNSAPDRNNSTSDASSLGRRIFSRVRSVKRLIGSKVVEINDTVPVDEVVALNVELLE